MACLHKIIYIGIANNNKEIKIGMTERTARARHNGSDYKIIAYYDFPTVPDRKTLFELEDELRYRAINRYGNPQHNSLDYFERPQNESQERIVEWFRHIVRTKGLLNHYFHEPHLYEEIPRKDEVDMTFREKVALL